MMLNEAYEKLGFTPVLEFEQKNAKFYRGDLIYEALDRGVNRVALITFDQAQNIPSWATAPVKIGNSWHAPHITL